MVQRYWIDACCIAKVLNHFTESVETDDDPQLQTTDRFISFQLMTFNAENLFDHQKSPDRRDETYLPIEKKRTPAHRKKCRSLSARKYRRLCLNLDWSEKALMKKLKKISQTILLAQNGKGPDLLVLQEVENIGVLLTLKDKFLPHSHYREAILLEGKDPRGINIAILSRFPLLQSPVLHAIPGNSLFEPPLSRGILEAQFDIHGKSVTIFGIHFPSPRHPLRKRQQAMAFLNQLGASKAGGRKLLMAAGDFNVPITEESQIYRRMASAHWIVAHFVGCYQCLGTYYFRRNHRWSFLDTIMVWRQSGTKWKIRPGSMSTLISENSLVNGAHGSDHLPFVMTMEAER